MSTDFRTRVPACVYYTMKQTALTGEKPTTLTVPGHSKWHKVSWAAISSQKDQFTNQILLCRPTAKMWLLLHGTNEESNNNKKHIQELREGKKKRFSSQPQKKSQCNVTCYSPVKLKDRTPKTKDGGMKGLWMEIFSRERLIEIRYLPELKYSFYNSDVTTS